jgi:hypothetical protein
MRPARLKTCAWRYGKKHEQQHEDERAGPLGQAQHRCQIADELDRNPGDNGVNGGHTIKVSAL